MNKFWQYLQHATRGFRHENVLAPITWYSLWFSLPCIALSLLFKEHRILQIILFFVGLLGPVITVLSYIYFAIKDPGRLQNTDWQLRDRALDMLKQGVTAGRPIEVNIIPAITNPESSKALPAPKEEGGAK